MISHIVSVLNRPHFLNAALATLAVQDGGQGEVIVCMNGTDPAIVDHCQMICNRYGASMLATGASDCYEAANMGARVAAGEWLSFPSDDSLLVFEFSRVMLDTAQKTGAGLIYCDCVYRQERSKGHWPANTMLNVEPRMGRIDKTTFIVKRGLFPGFPAHPRGWCDGAMIEKLVQSGVKHAKAPGVLVVHQ